MPIQFCTVIKLLTLIEVIKIFLGLITLASAISNDLIIEGKNYA